jgi:Glucose-6-phosphate dehydrogenase, NAD binding domain
MNPANELVDTQRGERHSMVAIREGVSTQSDALVEFFGATGDLAYKKIFPALQAMAKHGNLNVPVIGVSRCTPDLSALKARASRERRKARSAWIQRLLTNSLACCATCEATIPIPQPKADFPLVKPSRFEMASDVLKAMISQS